MKTEYVKLDTDIDWDKIEDKRSISDVEDDFSSGYWD